MAGTNGNGEKDALSCFILSRQQRVIHGGSREETSVSNGYRTLRFGYGYWPHTEVLYYDSPDPANQGKIMTVDEAVDAFLAP
jgi:hypothetical protein